jgi:hypothetical protein
MLGSSDLSHNTCTHHYPPAVDLAWRCFSWLSTTYDNLTNRMVRIICEATEHCSHKTAVACENPSCGAGWHFALE